VFPHGSPADAYLLYSDISFVEEGEIVAVIPQQPQQGHNVEAFRDATGSGSRENASDKKGQTLVGISVIATW